MRMMARCIASDMRDDARMLLLRRRCYASPYARRRRYALAPPLMLKEFYSSAAPVAATLPFIDICAAAAAAMMPRLIDTRRYAAAAPPMPCPLLMATAFADGCERGAMMPAAHGALIGAAIRARALFIHCCCFRRFYMKAAAGLRPTR